MVTLASSVVMGADRPGGLGFATRSPVVARHGMVAAAHPLAVQIGLDVLKRGGSAVDAAIAVNAALGLMEPTSCGLGGDIYAMVWDPGTRKLWGLNGSGRAPAALTIDKVPPEKDGTIPEYSPYAWTVPGCVDGWIELHREVRAPAARGAAGTRHRLRQGRCPGAPGDRRELGARACPASRTSPALPRSSCPAAGRPARASRSPTRRSPAPSR